MYFALRSLVKNPGFTGLTVLSLAAGVGLTAALASVADAILFRPLAVARAGEIVRAYTASPGQSLGFVSYPDFEDFRSGSRTLAGVIAQSQVLVAVGGQAGAPAQVRMGMAVTPDYFDVLGVPPARGRPFRVDEAREPVVVLAYEFFVSRYAADQGIIGRAIQLGGVAFTVIGVAAKDFGLDRFVHEDFYVPMGVYEAGLLASVGRPMEDRGRRYLSVYGRLSQGATLSQARAELEALAARLAVQHPETNRERRAVVLTEFQARMRADRSMPRLAGLLLAMAVLILSITCANVAGLTLERGEARVRDTAVRAALGASEMRLLAHSLTESLVLAAAGGGLGIPLAWAATRILATSARLPTDMPFTIAARMDARVAVFTILVTALVAVWCGLAPWIGTRGDVFAVLKARRTGGGTRARSVLVAVEIALATMSVATGGLLLKGLNAAKKLDLGYRTDHVLVMTLDPGQVRYSAGRTRAFYREVLERTPRIPGVKAVTLAQAVPLGYLSALRQISIEAEAFTTWMNIVDRNYFELMHIQIVAGRGFEARDTESSMPVIVINEELAKRWNGYGPIRMNGRKLQVIGVARTAKYFQLDEPPRPYFYLPYSQNYSSRMVLHVETEGNPVAAARRALREIQSIDPGQPVSEIRALDDYFLKGALFSARVGMQAVGVIGACGLLLALAGLYGVVSTAVARRSREIAIRMALGARQPATMALVLRQGMRLTAAGIGAGLGAAVMVSAPIASMIAGAGKPDPWGLGAAALVVTGASLAAQMIPAVRASGIDPAVALREE